MLCATACIWYFSDDRKNLHGTIGIAFSWAFFFHFGTIAFGSFILALIWLIRILLESAKKKAEEEGRNDFVISCVKCLVECIEGIVQYVTKHAYIETILRGTPFCPSTINAMKLIASNILNIGTLHGMTGLISFFTTIFVIGVTLLLSTFLMKGFTTFGVLVFETFIPLLVC